MRSIEAYSYGCVMAVLPEPLAEKVRGFAALIPDEDLHEDDEGEQGREDMPHVTVKYGLHTDKVKEVRDVLGDQPPVKLTLGRMSAFHNDDYVVLKLEVDSPDLHEFNKLISENLECTDTFPVYNPHITIAYLKHHKDDEHWYRKLFSDMFEGEEVEVDKLRFSTADEKEHWVKLSGSSSKVAARVAMMERVARRFMAAPHLFVECDGEMEPVDMYIELYGTGKLDKRYERLLEKYFKTKDKKVMMRKFHRMNIVPVQCPRGDLELVDKDSGAMIKRVR
jgi:2'-5' RNA ligase